MSVLLQISDPHFGTERPEVVEGLVRFARAQAPEAIVLSGDITQRATRSEFAAARAFADRLAGPALLVVPGNHDIPLFDLASRLLRPYARYEAAFGSVLEPEWESPAMRVVTLNTTRAWRHKHGELSPAQIERVAERLIGAAARQLRIVVVHHPLAVIRAEDRVHLARGHREALRAWGDAGADLIVGGHIHLPYLVPLHERDRGLAHRLWVLQAGTAVSTRVRHEAGNSVNVIRHIDGSSRRCRIERWDWNARLDDFEPAARHELACGPVGVTS
jgi:3',5'-cyclic AMP phosphodiesterase CpdA